MVVSTSNQIRNVHLSILHPTICQHRCEWEIPAWRRGLGALVAALMKVPSAWCGNFLRDLGSVSPSLHITTAYLPHPFSSAFSCIFVWGEGKKERLLFFSPYVTFIIFSSPSCFILCPWVNDSQVFFSSKIEEEYMFELNLLLCAFLLSCL